jgi:hypothetical protein
LQKLIPQLEEAVEKKDRLLRQAQTQIESQQQMIQKLEADVKNLQVCGLVYNKFQYFLGSM